ncbi:MAG TPA: glycosyltransferase [Methylomirabilota bacterium]|jgi:glycosyltransferase involved in cell wall biosynthesis
MTHALRLSIVVCTYNRAHSLALTLAALDAQETPPELGWDLLVVDNNSTDESRAVIDAFLRTAKITARSIFVAPQGLSHARNAAIVASRAEIVAFTDDDVTPAPDWVARMAAAMNGRRADVLGGRILPLWSHSPPEWLTDQSFHGMLTIMDHPGRVDVIDAHRQPCVWGANMALRRKVFDAVGLFDTRRGLQGARRYGGEDTELVRRALAAGYRVVYDPSVLVWHRIGRERMRLRYVSQVAFQRAEGERRVRPHTRGVSVLGIPLVLYRSLAKQVARWLTALTMRRSDTVQRWLDCCRCAGAMWGARRQRLDEAADHQISTAR